MTANAIREVGEKRLRPQAGCWRFGEVGLVVMGEFFQEPLHLCEAGRDSKRKRT